MKYSSKFFELKFIKRVLDWLATGTWLSTKRLHGYCDQTAEKKESTEASPLSNGTLRYKRNILALSAGILAWWWFKDDIIVEQIQSFGITIKKEASLIIIVLLLCYNAINYAWKAYIDWCSWAAELRTATFFYLRMIFGVWPDLSVMTSNNRRKEIESGAWRRERDVRQDGNGRFVRFRIIPHSPANSYLFQVVAPIARVSRARNRLLQFFFLDVVIPMVVTIAAVLIIVSRLNTAQAADH